MSLIKTNIPGYYKDTETKTIINKNYEELDMFMSQRERSKRMKLLEKETQSLRNELNSMRELLQKLIEK